HRPTMYQHRKLFLIRLAAWSQLVLRQMVDRDTFQAPPHRSLPAHPSKRLRSHAAMNHLWSVQDFMDNRWAFLLQLAAKQYSRQLARRPAHAVLPAAAA